MFFQPLGFSASIVLANIAEARSANRDPAALVNFATGEPERVAWLRKTDQPRRIDRSLLTENFQQNWNVHAQGAERVRQAKLAERIRRRARARE